MKKNELIEILSNLPGNPRILIEGYEGGLTDVKEEKIRFVPIVLLDANECYNYTGPHEEVSLDDIRARLLWDDKAYESCNAYIIER